MKVLEDIQPYINYTGLVQDKATPRRVSGNGVLRTAEACIVLDRLGGLTDTLKLQFARAVKQAELEPGFPCREPDGGERLNQDSVDNAVGRIIIARWCSAPHLVSEWLAFGRRGWKLPWIPFRIPFYYPNETQYQTKFGWRSLFWKFLALRCAMEWENGESPSWLLRMGWDFSISNTDGPGQDSFILSGLLVEHARRLMLDQRHPWVYAACQAYDRSFHKQFPGGEAEMYALYFREYDGAPPNTDHWIVKAYKELGG